MRHYGTDFNLIIIFNLTIICIILNHKNPYNWKNISTCIFLSISLEVKTNCSNKLEFKFVMDFLTVNEARVCWQFIDSGVNREHKNLYLGAEN